MNFGLTEEQKRLKATVRDFVARECPRQYIRELDKEGRYPHELYEKMVKVGWMGLPFPEEYGGAGGNAIDYAIVEEELASGAHVAAAMYLFGVGFGGMPIYHYGNEEQKHCYLPKLINEGMKFSMGFTEPNAGSDLGAATTTAVRDGDSYIINGSKIYTSSGHVADRILLLARTDKNAPKHEGLTVFLVDAKTPGIEVKRLEILGHRAVGTNEVFYTDVRVPQEDMLGSLNQGWKVALGALDIERLGIAAMSVGNAQLIIDDALQHAKQRVQFGRPIGKFQVIQHMLADMQTKVNASRLLTYQAAWMLSENIPASTQAAMAKLYASEVFMDCAGEGMQIMGGVGYTMDYDMQRYFRDARLYEIGGGSSQMQRNVIARSMGL